MTSPQKTRRLVCALGVGSSVLAVNGISPASAIAQTSVTFTQPAAEDWRAASAGYAALKALAAGEARGETVAPVLDDHDLSPSGIKVMRPDDPGWEAAQLSLEDTLAALVVPPMTVEPPPPVDGVERLRAKRLYVSGMAKRTAGENEEAARDFAAAAQLDPGEPAPWLRLAESQARTGQGPASLLSRRRAADLGDNDPVSLYILGNQLARLGQHELAAHYLARCVTNRPDRVDPLLGPIAYVRLAASLEELGSLRAAAEAIGRGLPTLTRQSGRTVFSGDATEISSEAGTLWLAAGDMASRIGDEALAAEAYARATSSNAGGTNRAMVSRQAFSLLRAGRPAGAVLLVLDDAAEHGGYLGLASRRVVESAGVHDAVAEHGAGALGDLLASLPDDATGSVVNSVVLGRAALVPQSEVRAMVLGEPRVDLRDPRVLDAVFASEPDAGARLGTARSLVRERPSLAQPIADALARWLPETRGAVADASADEAARLLRAEMLMHAGRGAAVVGMGCDLSAAPPPLCGVVGRAAAVAGDWDTVEAAVASLDGHPVELARVLFAAQRFGEAFEALEPALGDDASVPSLLLAGELAVASGAPANAETFFASAVGLDPFDERGYTGLMRIYQGFGDARRAAEASRLLESRLPGAWAVRWRGVQEQVAQGNVSEAEVLLRALLADSPDRPEPVELLVQIWAQLAQRGEQAALDDALAWVETATETLPTSPGLWAARGHLLAMTGRVSDAETLLRGAFEASPSVVLSRALERVLRERGKGEEADRVAAERFAAAGAGIEACLDRAESLARGQHWAEIPAMLQRAMPARATLTPRQRERVLALISAVASQDGAGLDAVTRAGLLTTLDLAQERGVALSWQLQSVRWTLLAADPEASDEAIVQAGRDFVESIDTVEVARGLTAGMTMPDPVPMRTLDEGRGCVAYLLANSLHGGGRETAALGMFRVVLGYYPDHAWAANDLGYFLVERHERLDEAEVLLTRAYALKPEQANIADSLAWLRYKTGRFTDTTGADGETVEGAVSLLRAAIALPGGENNATIYDHLGDALWRAGERDRALSSWIRAQQLLFDQLVRLRDGGRSAARDRLSEEAGAVGAKVDAVRNGAEPEVAPVFSDS